MNFESSKPFGIRLKTKSGKDRLRLAALLSILLSFFVRDMVQQGSLVRGPSNWN